MHVLKIYRGVTCNDTEEWWNIWRGIDLSFQNWHKKFYKFWLEHSKLSKIYTLMLLTKVYDVWAKKLQRDYVWWHWRLMPNLKENWLVLSKMTYRIWEIFVCRLKNSDFILESKMAVLNHNKNSKKPGRRDAVWKLYFTLEINE